MNNFKDKEKESINDSYRLKESQNTRKSNVNQRKVDSEDDGRSPDKTPDTGPQLDEKAEDVKSNVEPLQNSEPRSTNKVNSEQNAYHKKECDAESTSSSLDKLFGAYNVNEYDQLKLPLINKPTLVFVVVITK